MRRAIADKDALPFPDDYFDGVIFAEVLEHLLFDPKMLVREMSRVLRPGGELIVTTPNVLRIENRVKMLLGRNVYPRHENFYFTDLYRRHNREYTMREVISLFQPPFLLKKARFIMATEFAVAVSDKGKVFDTREYAEVVPTVGTRRRSRWNSVAVAKFFLRWSKHVYPPFRSGLLVSFISSKTARCAQ